MLHALIIAAQISAAQPMADLVDEGIKQYEALDYTGAVLNLRRALRDKELAEEAKVTALVYLARSLAVLGRSAKATRRFRQLLALHPDFQISWEESPRIREAFERAKNPFESLPEMMEPPPPDHYISEPTDEMTSAVPVWAIAAGGIAVIGGLVGVILWRQSTSGGTPVDPTAIWQLP
ncbi:MAG: hypothetical protein V3T05_02660 [Myxococcota bacterium]